MPNFSKLIATHIADFLKRSQCNTRLQADPPVTPEDTPATETSWQERAGVMLLLHKPENSWDIILTQRASHLNKHASQVAFPGGKYEQGDTDMLDTALRETYEEIGIDPKYIETIAAMRPRVSRYSVLVHPYIGILAPQANYYCNSTELEAVFKVPMHFFCAQKPDQDVFQFQGKQLTTPCWLFENYKIWGLTAKILEDFLRQSLKLPVPQHL